MSQPLDEEHVAPHVYDVLIVGAGPCGLAVASRLREETPSAMFTDEEQQRYNWIRKHAGRMSIKDKRTLTTKTAQPTLARAKQLSMLVLDESGDKWMSKWNRLFKTFEISHLRSPMFFHVDPRDRDGLLSYAHEQQRVKELIEIGGCVGQERSKHQRKKDRGGGVSFREPAIDERDRKDYYTPSSPLFRAHCEDVVGKYCLGDDLVRQGSVRDIDFDYVEGVSEVDKIFTVTTSEGELFAKTVVLSVGAGNIPHIPQLPGVGRIEGACHAMHIRQFPDPSIMHLIRAKRNSQIVIVGGGLTAAHLAANAIEKGVHHVHMILRSHLKVKPFDIDLAWMGKFRNIQQAYFWSADSDEERWEQIQVARGGGSITPRIHKVLKKYCDQGKLSIHTNTSISSRGYDEKLGRWAITTEPGVDLPAVDYIYFATGIPTDYTKLPYLQTLLQKCPIDGIGGLPCLSEDMAWDDDVPLFMTGKLASLRIGPGAGNLAGARIGAERIAWSIQERIGANIKEEKQTKVDGVDRYHLGIGNRFESLTGSETDCSGECSDTSED